MQGSNLEVVAPATPEHTRHFKKLYPTLESLEAAAEHARALVTSPGWPVLLDMLGAEVAKIDALLDSGRVLEHAEYAVKHGRRGGLRAPAAFLHALIEHAESELEKQRVKHERDAGSSHEGD